VGDFMGQDGDKLHALLFTGRSKVPMLLAQLAEIFSGRVVLGCALCEQTQVCGFVPRDGSRLIMRGLLLRSLDRALCGVSAARTAGRGLGGVKWVAASPRACLAVEAPRPGLLPSCTLSRHSLLTPPFDASCPVCACHVRILSHDTRGPRTGGTIRGAGGGGGGVGLHRQVPCHASFAAFAFAAWSARYL